MGGYMGKKDITLEEHTNHEIMKIITSWLESKSLEYFDIETFNKKFQFW